MNGPMICYLLLWIIFLSFVGFMVTWTGNAHWAWVLIFPAITVVHHKTESK